MVIVSVASTRIFGEVGNQQKVKAGNAPAHFISSTSDNPFYEDPRFIGSGFLLLVGSLIFVFTLYYRDLEKKVHERTESLNKEIQERIKIENDLMWHKEQLEMLNKILRHDIINDVAAIKSSLNMFTDTRDEKFLDVAYTYIDKSVDLINKMRESEKFLSTNTKFKIYELRDVFKNVVNNYPNVKFDVKGKCKIMADDSLSSVIDNIISNAQKHGGADAVTVRIDKSGDLCRLVISDNGEGIDDNIKKRIFDEGFTSNTDSHSGMGLHIVNKIVQSWGGSVLVGNNVPKGTVFTISLQKVV